MFLTSHICTLTEAYMKIAENHFGKVKGGLVYKDGFKKFASANGICWNGGGDEVKAKK